jgi:DNA (cytosine-5)-methyltransferase 1
MSAITFGSVCSGIEAASVAWHPLGWRPVWYAEIEPFPCAVLAYRYPDVPNLGDMTTIAARVTSGEVDAPDVLVGGTPCQAFSIAGLRNSLQDARGQLTLSYVGLANAIDSTRHLRGQPATIVVWENVPGVLSTKDNAFGCFLGALAGEDRELEPPRDERGGATPVAERWLCIWTPANNRMADTRRPIFRSGPTTPSCAPCRKCSRGVRSRRGTF